MTEQTELTEPAEVIVLSTNEELRKDMQYYAGWYRQALQEAYVAFVALGLGEITLTELDGYNVASAEKLVKEKLYESNQAFKGLGLDKAKVMELMELPPTVADFKAAMESLRKWTAYRRDADTRGKFPAAGHFEVEKGAVVARPSLQAWIDSKTQDRLTDPKQVAAYREAEKLAKQIRVFEEEYGVSVIPHSGGTSVFTRGVMVKGKGFYDRETIDYTDILVNKSKIKSIK